MALTATASKMTVDDIMQRLKLRNCASFTQSFNRTNLNYIILPKKRVLDDIVSFINSKHRGKTGIIYCLGRQKCETVAQELRKKGLSAKHFHALLESSDKEKIQLEWQNGQCHIIVATVCSLLVYISFTCRSSAHVLSRLHSVWALISRMVRYFPTIR